ncbi:unnamed protein product [Symbiodinium sp. CCMP2592]|nr:unnamed protein product [Symbiodinium sp. CCMP2592]
MSANCRRLADAALHLPVWPPHASTWMSLHDQSDRREILKRSMLIDQTPIRNFAKMIGQEIEMGDGTGPGKPELPERPQKGRPTGSGEKREVQLRSCVVQGWSRRNGDRWQVRDGHAHVADFAGCGYLPDPAEAEDMYVASMPHQGGVKDLKAIACARLVREQTANCIKDLNALRAEVMTLKSDQESQRLSQGAAVSSLEGKQLETKNQLEREMRYRDTAFQQQVQKVSELEQDMPSLHEQISYMKEQLRVLETAWHPHIEEIQASHLKHVEKLAKLEQKTAELDGSFAVHAGRHKELEVHQHALRQHLEDEKATRDHTIQDLHAKLSRHGEQHSTVQDRVDYLERLMGGSADRQAKGHMPFTDRMEYLEQFMGDSLGKHEKELAATAAKVGDHADKHGKALAELQAKITSDTKSSHASLAERLQYVEQLLGDSVSKHAQELESAKAKLEEMHVRVSGCEAHGDSLKMDHNGSKARLEEHHATLQQRLDFLEKAMGDSFEKHDKAVLHRSSSPALLVSLAHGASLETLKKAHSNLQSEKQALEQNHANLVDRVEKVHNALTSQKAQQDVTHASLRERVEFLESTMGDNADKHSKALADLHSKMASDAKSNHASVSERLAYVEQMLGDSASKHAKALAALALSDPKSGDGEAFWGMLGFMQELADARAKLDDMHARVSGCEAHGEHIDALKKSHSTIHSTVTGSKAKLDEKLEEHHASLSQRMDFLEKAMGDSFDKHAKELAATAAKVDAAHSRVSDERIAREAHAASLETLKKAHGSLLSEKQMLDKNHQALAEGLDKVQGTLSSQKAQQDVTHASLRERVEFLESSLGDNADKHGKALAELKASHAKILSGKDSLRVLLSERLQYVEQTIGDSLAKHAQELADARAKLGDMHARVSQCEVHGEHIDSLKKSHATMSGNKAKLEEKLEEHHATLNERVNALEKELASTGAKVDAAHSRVTDERTAREAHAASLDTLHKAHNSLQSQKAQQDAVHASLRERVEFLESSIGDNADKHGKALAELRASHAKLVTDSKSKETAHSSFLGKDTQRLTERLQYIEQLLGDSASKHAQELADARAKLDDMHARVSKCEVQGEQVDSLKKAQNTMAGGKAALEEHHASLAERVGYLEKALGDSADRHSAELATTRSKVESLHSRLGVEQQEQSQNRAKHYSLEERLNFLETYLGESKEKHGSSADSRLEGKLEDLRTQIHSERSTRTRQGEAISEHLESEKRAREALEEAVAHHMANHRQTMEALESHEKRVQEQFGHERMARERHVEHVEALVKQEKDARGQHHEIHTDLISKERAARQQIEDLGRVWLWFELLQKETHERSRHHETIGERVDSLQRTVGIFDTLMRKEIEERGLEMQRVWEAVDGHTHDLSSKMKEGSDVEEIGEVDGTEIRFRPNRSRSGPSLPGLVSSPSVRSVQSGTSTPVMVYKGYPQVRQGSPIPQVLPTAAHERITVSTRTYPAVAAPVTTTQTYCVASPPMVAPITAAVPMVSGGIVPTGSRSNSPSRRMGDHAEVSCGKAHYHGERSHNATVYP